MLLLYLYLTSHLFMAISGQSCGPRVSARLLAEIPCDMSVNSFCTQPGSAYPWAPLRRYIVENQGSLKRMYGEFRQSNVVQEEIDRFSARYANLDSNTFTEFEIRKARNSNGFVVDAVEEKTGNDETFTSILASTTSTTSAPSTTTTSGSTSSSTATSMPTSASPSSSESPTTTTSTSAQSPEPETTQSPVPEAVYIEEEEEESSTHVLNFDDVLTGRDQLPAEPDNTLPESEEKEEVPKEEPKGYPACPIAQEVVAPYWANNTRGETLALLNVYPFEQYIHWEKCAHEGEQMFCREGCKCEQQYRLHRLLAFDPKSECRGIFADWFRFPGSCACVCYDSLPDRINSRKARL